MDDSLIADPFLKRDESAVERFGGFVPKVIPEGCKVHYARIGYYNR